MAVLQDGRAAYTKPFANNARNTHMKTSRAKKPLRIWLIYPYGALPGEAFQLDRPSMIANALTAAGHEVVWWVSAFDHRRKTFRATSFTDISLSPNDTIRLVPTSGYAAHVSLKRIASEMRYARNVRVRARDESKPDVVFLSEPALFISGPVMDIVRESGARLVIDNKDLWPEQFHSVLPRPLRRLAPLILAPLYRRRASLFQHADAVIAVCESYLALSRRLAPFLSADRARAVYWGADVTGIRNMMQSKPPTGRFPYKHAGEIWALFASTLGDNYGVDTLLKAATELHHLAPMVRIIIAGTGPRREDIERALSDDAYRNCYYAGDPTPSEMASLYSQCDLGISSYLAASRVGMPIKAFHYLAAGLPIVNSLSGDLAALLAAHGAGIQFKAEDAMELANAIARLAKDTTAREQMSERAFALGSEFDAPRQYSPLAHLAELIADHP